MAKTKKVEIQPTENTETKTTDKIFHRGLSDKSGSIETVGIQAVVKDVMPCGMFNETMIEKALDTGELFFSDGYTYSSVKQNMVDFMNNVEPSIINDPEFNQELPQESAEDIQEKELDTANDELGNSTTVKDIIPISETVPKVGDIAYNESKVRFGEVVEKDGKLKVEFTLNGALKTVNLTKDYRKATDEEITGWKQSIALEKPSEVIQGEVVLPPTEEETKQFEDLKDAFREAQGEVVKIHYVQGAILDKIRKLGVQKFGFNSLGAFAAKEFGITASHAQELAKVSGYHELIQEFGDVNKELEMSYNATNALVKNSNKMMEGLGFTDFEARAIAPLLKSTVELLVTVAPKNFAGVPQITPRVVNALANVINANIKTGVVEIDGQQMSVLEAQRTGVLNVATIAQVMEQCAEGIRQNTVTVVDEYKRKWEESNQPIKRLTSGGSDSSSSTSKVVPNEKVWTAKPSAISSVVCDRHGETTITNIASGLLQLGCKCRFAINSVTNKLECYEVQGMRVKDVGIEKPQPE